MDKKRTILRVGAWTVVSILVAVKLNAALQSMIEDSIEKEEEIVELEEQS